MAFDLESDNFVPSWYELSIDKNILFINIHKIAWLFFVNILGKNEKIINDYKEQFFKAYKNNLNFIFPNLKKPWGFGEIITFCFENNDWVSFKCKLPQNCENGNFF